MTDLVGHDDPAVGRSASPPGRESREDWRGRGQEKNGRLDPERKKSSRSRSRSPLRRRRRSFSPNKEMRYSKEGTNTTSREPHLERARLFVGNIEPRAQRKDLVDLFSQFGVVLGVSVHKGYAFVQMHREKAANKAINYEDDKVFMGSKIHVEFSQAALKAGAKFQRLSLCGSPPRPLPPPHDHRVASLATDPYIEEQERAREERLSRILRMERELSLLRSQEENINSKPVFHPPVDSHDRDIFYRRSPAPHPASGYQSSYSRDRDSGASYHATSSSMGVGDRARSYYSRNSPPREHATRGISGSMGSYRDSVSYPQLSSSAAVGYSRGAPAVGYTHGGSSAGSMMGGLNSSLPSGWGSSDNKPPVNRPAFSVGGPWS